MKNIIIGTAGHIDHGKTALIEAMNGYNGDELEEEKKKGITIDLSFSNMKKGDTNIAFIDVPGHEKLIKNMISGAFGFDVCLFVIDVNEGLMPQTIEHLEVLNFLDHGKIIIALSKCDLSTKMLVEKREKEIKEFVGKYKNIKILKIFHTSIKDKESIENLKEYLFDLKIEKEDHKENFFRYYIDRIFSLKGFGEIATGTVINGEIQKDKKVYVCELDKDIVVKNIQVHSKDTLVASKHQRAAINLNIPHGKLKKGYLLTNRGYFRGFDNIDIFIKCREGYDIKHNQILQFLCGAKNLPSKITIYSKEKDGYFAKASFKEKVYLMHNDKIILLLNNEVVAGGIVLNPINDPIKKSKKITILRNLYNKKYDEAFLELCNNHKKGFGLISSLQRFAISHEEALGIANKLDGIYVDEKELVIYPQTTKKIIENIIKEIYTKNPYALLSASSIKLRIKWASESFIKDSLEIFVKNGFLKLENGLYKRVDLADKDIEKELEKKIFAIMENSSFNPPAPYNLYDSLDIDRKLGDTIFKKLTKSKKIVRITHNLFITSSNLSKIISIQKEIIKKEGYIEIKNFKNHLQLSRKYLIGYLEYLDRLNEIKKEGNKRFIVG